MLLALHKYKVILFKKKKKKWSTSSYPTNTSRVKTKWQLNGGKLLWDDNASHFLLHLQSICFGCLLTVFKDELRSNPKWERSPIRDFYLCYFICRLSEILREMSLLKFSAPFLLFFPNSRSALKSFFSSIWINHK